MEIQHALSENSIIFVKHEVDYNLPYLVCYHDLNEVPSVLSFSLCMSG